MATRIKSTRSRMRPDRELAYARAVKAAHEEYTKQREIMLKLIASDDAINGVDSTRLIAETLERIKSFGDGTNNKKEKGRKKK
jgi:predicted amino acid racemase